MSKDLMFLILLPFLLFLLWFGSEFRAPLFVRLTFGTVFFVMTMLVGGVSIVGTHLGAQADYGRAAKRLVQTMRQKIESDDCEAARQLVDKLDESFQPSYEGIGFPIFVDRAIESISGEPFK